MSTLAAWLERQEAASATAITAAVSATGLRHRRPGFGQEVVPAAGSVLASPLDAHWDPEPDYFYHWARDAGVVMAIAPLLAPADPDGWTRRLADYVRFSLEIATRPGPPANPLRATTRPDHTQFLREDADLASLAGDRLLGEPRVNADGMADCERWGRPQFDGPALRALSLLAWDGPLPPEADALLALDLGHVLAHAAAPSIGPWEEEPAARCAFTLLAQRAALRRGADRLGAAGIKPALAAIETALDGLCDGENGHLRAYSAAAPDVTDAAAILGVLLDPLAPTFGVDDPRVLATAHHVEEWSRAAYPITTAEAPLVGRWPQDIYFGGNPWLPTSLGFAEFHFVRARTAPDRAAADAAFARGEAFFEAVRRLLPDAGALPEQLERQTGAPISCRDLTWSHAALIAVAEARRAALRRRAAPDAGS